MRALDLPDALRHDWIGPLRAAPTPDAPPDRGWARMASRLRELEDEFARAEFDQATVDALRQAITEGRFVVDSSAVAAGLLRAIVPASNRH